MLDPILKDFLDQLEQWLKELDDLLDTAPDIDDPETQQTIRGTLNEIESHIDAIFDPQQAPVLSPPDAGTPDESVEPTTLRQYVKASLTLTTQAKGASEHEEIGSRLKTILHLLPGFRDAVRIV